jgi:CBS-domain-containing membrane protein
MAKQFESLKPVEGAARPLRQRLGLKGELALALLPTLVILAVLLFVNVLTEQRLLFASLSASAFLIYLDPEHGTNRMRTLIISQLSAAIFGLATYFLLGSVYLSAGIAMVVTIIFMITLDVVHPPAVSTSLSFALRAGDESNLVIFGLATAITATLIILQKAALRMLIHFSSSHFTHENDSAGGKKP